MNSGHEFDPNAHIHHGGVFESAFLNGERNSCFPLKLSFFSNQCLYIGAARESHVRVSNRGDSESDILEQTPDTDDSGPHSCPGEWTKHANANGPVSVHLHKNKNKTHKVTSPPIKECSTSFNPQKVYKMTHSLENKFHASLSYFHFQVQVVALEVQNVKRAISRYGTLPKGARIGAYLESLRHNGVEGDGGNGNNESSSPAPPTLLSVSKMSCAQPGNMIRSNSSGGFQPTSISSLARNRAAPPSLADLEFPPPPPPEELECEDVTNLRPSAEEASFRFGVNLRHREPSTDSCASAKSERSTKPLADDGSRSLPPSPPGPAANANQNRNAKEESEANEKTSLNRKVYKSVLPGIMKEMMELKLVSDQKAKSKDENVSLPDKATKSNRFKVQLKKVDAKKPTEDSPIDMKVRLKKVDNGKTVAVAKDSSKTANGDSLQPGKEEEDKRCSTGSINSLKKLWEGESPPEVAKERKVWPPDEKPAIAIKPTAKTASKQAIYATPGALATVLDVWQVLENSLTSLKSCSNISSASWLLLSDKVSSFQSSCLSYVDSAAPPQTKFQLRELLTKLDAQARLLRTTGTRNRAENDKVLNDLHNVLNDVINAVQK